MIPSTKVGLSEATERGTAVVAVPFQATSVTLLGCIHRFLRLLTTGMEVDIISGATTDRCSVHALKQSLRVRFADGRPGTQTDTAVCVKGENRHAYWNLF